MKIYDYEGFPNPARVRIALAEKGVLDKVTFITVDLPAGEHRQPQFLAKNPMAAVPVLELADGTTIAECTAITEYLDNAFDGPILTGRTPVQRAMVHMMQRRAEASVLDAVGGYFHHATPGLGETLESNQNADWGLAQRDVAIAGMRYFNSLLAKQDYAAGAEYSMADITLFAGIAFADFAKVEIPAECNHLHAWREKVGSRPAIAG